MEKIKGKFLGTYEISRKYYYKRLFVPVLVIMSVTSSILYFYTSDAVTILVGTFSAVLFCFLTLAVTNSEYFNRRFCISAYDNGLEIYQLGFFEWEDLFLFKEKKENILILKNGYIRNQELKWQPFLKAMIVRFKNWGDDEVSPATHLHFRFNIPSSVTNIPYDDFLRMLDTKIKIHMPYDTVTR